MLFNWRGAVAYFLPEAYQSPSEEISMVSTLSFYPLLQISQLQGDAENLI